MYEYIRLNTEPISIEYVPDEHEEKNDFKPSFWFNNKRYFIEDFVRVHNNPWINDTFPEFIHAMEQDNYFNPLFIELINDETLNIYEERSVA